MTNKEACRRYRERHPGRRAEQQRALRAKMDSETRQLYSVWNTMKGRCHNPTDPNYDDYGGRGIKVCARWRNSFAAFVSDMGPRPPGRLANGRAMYELDRWPNNNGNYEPSNCRWVTHKDNCNNRRPRSCGRKIHQGQQEARI